MQRSRLFSAVVNSLAVDNLAEGVEPVEVFSEEDQSANITGRKVYTVVINWAEQRAQGEDGFQQFNYQYRLLL